MKLLNSKKLKSNVTRKKLLACIQTLSDYFQKVVMLRNVFCEDSRYLPVTQNHLKEEFFHNLSLMEERKNKPAQWDPILESTSSWFAWKMITLNEQEKTLLVHFVLEASGNLFFQKAYPIMKMHGKADYFKLHSEADEEHEKMGGRLLKNISQDQFSRMLEVLTQGWEVMTAVSDRIAELSK